MSNSPLSPISVIVPTFNQAKFLPLALASILDQSYPHLEVIVVDGGSTDHTVEILKKYGDRIRWVSERDRGQTDAVNKGFRMATNEVLGWLNSDDLYERRALWTAGKFFAENPGTMWAFGDCRIIDETGKEIRKWITRYKSWRLRHYSYTSLLIENYISQMGVFIRREALKTAGELSIDLNYVMDYDLWLRLAKHFQPGLLDAPIGQFRMYETTKSMIGFKKQFAEEFEVAKNRASDPLLSLLHYLNYLKITGIYSLIHFWQNLFKKRNHDL